MDDFATRVERAAQSLGFLSGQLPEGTHSAESAIRYLVGQLVHAGQLAAHEAEATIRMLLKREWLGSTNAGKGLAVPHGMVCSIERLIGVLGRSEVGMSWDSSDDLPVLCVCLTLAPLDRPGDHLRALERLVPAAK